ncbi:GroES-like protein [Trichoderma evansii]
MTIPETFKSYRRTASHTLVQSSETTPKNLGDNDVLIKIHSISLNYRDVVILQGGFPIPVLDKGIPASDCAAEVVAVGSAVQKFKVGDRVSPNFYVNHFTGEESEMIKALGGDVEGVLSEYAVFTENLLVPLPDYLTWNEGATIACAGVTAWSALGDMKKLSPERSYVLLEGTGGISMFALLLLIDAGIKTIITSSSDAKIAQIEKLSHLVTGVNYTTHPDISAEVKRITNGRGVDLVVNNVGPKSIPSNIDYIRRGGEIAAVGFLDGVTAEWNPGEVMLSLLFRRGTIRGILVGSKMDFEALCAHLAEKKIGLQPLLDRVFTFDEAKDAFDHMIAKRHAGKIIIKVAE